MHWKPFIGQSLLDVHARRWARIWHCPTLALHTTLVPSDGNFA